MSVLRSLLFYAIFYPATAVMALIAILMPIFGKRFAHFVPNAWSRLHRLCVSVILGVKIRQEGERVSGPVLYAIKHEAFFEAIDLPMILELPVPFAKQELFTIPLWGRAARAYGAIPVARDKGATALRSMLSEARRYLDSGRALVIFPEGTRVPHNRQRRLQSGFAGLYKLLGLPVVPVAVDSGPLYHRWWKRSGTITYRFGEPIPPGLPRAELEVRVQEEINALNDPKA